MKITQQAIWFVSVFAASASAQTDDDERSIFQARATLHETPTTLNHKMGGFDLEAGEALSLLQRRARMLQKTATAPSASAASSNASSAGVWPPRLLKEREEEEEEEMNMLDTGSAARMDVEQANTKPHLLFILADDLGYANVGFTRSTTTPEVSTPTMDTLASNGIVLERMYVHHMCSPTRSAIQSGRNPMHVNVVQAHPYQYNPSDPEGGFSGIPRSMTGLGEVMRKGGYKTHFVGKWDAGMATPDHTPAGRGYDTALNYFGHMNDYWKFGTHLNAAGDDDPGCASRIWKDLWEMNSSTEFPGAPAISRLNSEGCSQAQQDAATCVYEDELFANQVKSTIRQHRAAEPLFVFWAPHAVHGPLQVPYRQLEKFSFILNADGPLGGSKKRQYYNGMVNYLDTLIGEVVQELEIAHLYQKTLIVFLSDNGGSTQGGNNYPLRGAKYSNFEGGIRVPAFISGGFLPMNIRGTRQDGLMTGWDWYATFAGLAGVDPTDHKAASAGLPAIDSVDLWPLLTHKTKTSPRAEHLIASNSGGYDKNDKGTTVVAGIIAPPFKIVIGQEDGNLEPRAFWSAPVKTPNHTSPIGNDPKVSCGRTPETGCMYDVWADESEYVNIAKDNPDLFQRLLAKVEAANNDVYSPIRTGSAVHCRDDVQQTGFYQVPGSSVGFVGPFLA